MICEPQIESLWINKKIFQKPGLYTQIGVINQGDNRKITQDFGFHILWQP